LSSASPRARRAALIALDQMDDGELDAATVARELTAPEPSMQQAAWWIAGRHPGWADTLAGHFRTRLASAGELTQGQRDELAGQLGRFAGSAIIQGLLADRLSDPKATRQERLVALRAMPEAPLKAVPPRWNAALVDILSGTDLDLVQAAVVTVRRMPANPGVAGEVIEQLRKRAADEKMPAGLRLAALSAVPRSIGKVGPGLFSFVLGHLDGERGVVERAQAADVLSRAELNREQLLELAGVLKKVGPMELEKVLDAFGRGNNEKVGDRLLAGLRGSPVRGTVQVDRLRARLAKYPAGVRKQAEALIADLDAEGARRKEHLDSLEASLDSGDIRRGQAVFNGAKAACASCHAIGYLGGKVGPDLTHIGKIRSGRDLLESILYPSASFVRSYEPVQVTTKRGQVYNGLVRKDTAEEIVLATNATEEVRIRRRDIDAIGPSKVSIMPAGMDKVLTKQELADLVAFLKACK
jgi:putative heme-binding domain-containing protein